MTTGRFMPFISRILSKNFKIKVVYWLSIYILKITSYKRYGENIPQSKIIIDLNSTFKIRVFALIIPPDHDMHNTCKNPVKNITILLQPI